MRADARVPLEFSAPADCPDRAYVLRAIEALSPANTPLADDRLERASVEIRAEGPAEFGLRVTWSGAAGSGNRQIAAESCRAAADTAAWLIALALHPERDQVAETQAETRTARAAALAYELGVGAGADSALLPSLGWAIAARVGLAIERVHVDLSAAYLPDQSARLGTARAELSLLEFGLTGCYLATLERWSLGPCARAALGRMAARAAPVSAAAPSTGSARTQSFGVGLHGRRFFSDSLGIFADLDAMWRQRRPVVVLAGAGTLHRTSSIGLHMVVGLTLTFR